ncbi:MarR family winged helix-turn-helix transcriptional regulator [Elioraea rosea]|uniref:MarR family winged helix-turn-helix transcriptional regulator n=1 Tax=Elioraea rosea TaxID=2492390 RepID=UPI0011843159|nr:MarR family transcriptional regulator [Elioraea rosea]
MDRVDEILAQWARERPGLDVGPMGPIGRVLRLSRHLMRALEGTLARHGLSFASFDVLATLRRSAPRDGLSPSALMAAMMVTSGTTTHRIDQLEAQGLVERQPNPDDQRSVIVLLSPRGRALIDAALEDYVACQAELMRALPKTERATLSSLLRTWLGALEGPTEAPTARTKRL